MNEKNVSLDFLMRVFRATAFDNCDTMFWRTDDEYAPLTIFAMCNDVFAWACADVEEITPSNIEILENSIKDVNEIGENHYGIELFCARVRKMRPQGACYELYSPKLAELFDACGPVRSVNEPGNTARKPYKNWKQNIEQK